MLVAHFSRREALGDKWHEERQHELVTQLIGDLSDMFLSAHRDIVFGYDLIQQLTGPLLQREVVDFREHVHVGWHHFVAEVGALADQGVVLVAEDQDACHCSAAEVHQQACSLHDLCVDHQEVLEDRSHEFGMRLH